MPAGPARLLLVEDEERHAQLFAIALAEVPMFQNVLERCDSLTAAKARLAKGGIDVVLLDLGLPESHGLPTLHALLPCATGIPVVVLSGQSDPESEEAALKAGAAGYISKNRMTSTGLVAKIEAALRPG
ncbi:MAG TPA: response regulator [Candidatus Thermoplasmatota archaeon]|nr:response regulator [Candidatus Thermoplasmatota archaeon]